MMLYLIAGVLTLVYALRNPQPGMYRDSSFASLIALFATIITWPMWWVSFFVANLIFRIDRDHWDRRKFRWADDGTVVTDD
jgi:hypothetical protein